MFVLDFSYYRRLETKIDTLLRVQAQQSRLLATIADQLQSGGMSPADVAAVTDRLKAHAAALEKITAEPAPTQP